MFDELDEYLQVILREMCCRVGADPEKVIIKQNEKLHWRFDMYSWTKEEENDYRKWLIDYFKTNKKAAKALIRWPNRVKNIKHAVEEILFMWGWRYK